MEDTVTSFVAQSRQLLVEFATQGQVDDEHGAAPGQRQFSANFTRLIDDFIDSLHDQEITVGAQH